MRPTREETRARLFEAAAEAFAEHGIGAATIEQIAAAAGFTRGAFYSNFDSKEELLLAMYEDHCERSVQASLALLDEHPDAIDFVEALRAAHHRDGDPLHNNPLLQMELVLHVARVPEQRPALAARLETMRKVIGEMAVSSLRAAGLERPVDPIEVGSLLMAMEDGFLLHRLIDPDSTPPDAFFQAVRQLQAVALGR